MTQQSYWAEVLRFKSDTGKFYDQERWKFDSDSWQTAVDAIAKHQASPKTNQSGFTYLLSGEGNLKNLHPKLFNKAI